jgi:hypothetical protein
MRMLAGYGVFAEDGAGRFILTPPERSCNLGL